MKWLRPAYDDVQQYGASRDRDAQSDLSDLLRRQGMQIIACVARLRCVSSDSLIASREFERGVG